MRIKAVSLNLWDGGMLLSEALDFIKHESPDILFLQEVYNSNNHKLEERFRTLEILIENLDLPYSNFAPEFIDNRKEGRIPQGNAIFSRFPIVDTNIVFFDRPLDENYVELPENFPTISRNLQHATLETNVGIINVFNFHGVWDLDGDNFSETRKNMTEVILKTIGSKQRVILAGDSNAKPTNQAIKNLERKLTSIFGDAYPSTFNMRRKDNPGYESAAVDMMFVSDDIEVVSKSIPDVDVSDHLPLISVLELH